MKLSDNIIDLLIARAVKENPKTKYPLHDAIRLAVTDLKRGLNEKAN